MPGSTDKSTFVGQSQPAPYADKIQCAFLSHWKVVFQVTKKRSQEIEKMVSFFQVPRRSLYVIFWDRRFIDLTHISMYILKRTRTRIHYLIWGCFLIFIGSSHIINLMQLGDEYFFSSGVVLARCLLEYESQTFLLAAVQENENWPSRDNAGKEKSFHFVTRSWF